MLIEAFVGIDEGEVESAFDLRYDVDGIAYVEVDKVAVRSRLELLADEVFEFVVDFDSMQFAIGGQTFSHAEGRVARVGAKLDDTARASHLDKEFEYAALQVARHHAWIDHLQMRFAHYVVEIFGLRFRVLLDVFVDLTIRVLGVFFGLR